MVKSVPNIDPDTLISNIFEELKRMGFDDDKLLEAKDLVSKDEIKQKIIEEAKIDKEKMNMALEIVNEIKILSNEIILLRYQIGEDSKIIGKKLFNDNSETSRIAANLPNHYVTDQNKFHIFIDDLHKYVIQSAIWKELYKKSPVKNCLDIIDRYRQSFDHIFDMKGEGKGTNKAYEDLRMINIELLGHKIIRINEYPKIQIRILEEIEKMLRIVENNIEDWLTEKLIEKPGFINNIKN